MKISTLNLGLIALSILTLGSCKKDDDSNSGAANGTADISAPTILSTDPIVDENNVPINKTITIHFSERMDSSTINATSFQVMQGNTNQTGVVSYSGNTASFTPSVNFDATSVYTVSISTDAKDLAGNKLKAAKIWDFITGNSSAALATVPLGSSANYVILAKTAINNSPTSAITGDLGLSPAATTYITGLALVDFTGYATSSQVTGKVFAANMASPTDLNLTVAVNNMLTAYNDAAGRSNPDYLELGTGDIGGMTLTAGLYKWGGTVSIPSDIAITGGANDIWIFQIAGDLSQSADVRVTLNGGAQAKNIFWQVAGEASFGTNSHIEGNILSMTAISFLTGASLTGRALAQTAVILDANSITKAL